VQLRRLVWSNWLIHYVLIPNQEAYTSVVILNVISFTSFAGLLAYRIITGVHLHCRLEGDVSRARQPLPPWGTSCALNILNEHPVGTRNVHYQPKLSSVVTTNTSLLRINTWDQNYGSKYSVLRALYWQHSAQAIMFWFVLAQYDERLSLAESAVITPHAWASLAAAKWVHMVSRQGRRNFSLS